MRLKEIFKNIKEHVIDVYNRFIDYCKKLFNNEEKDKHPEQDIKIVNVKVTGVKVKKKTNLKR